MNKTIKIISILMMVVLLCTMVTPVFAVDAANTLETLNTDIHNAKDDQTVRNSTAGVSSMAGRVISVMRTVAVIVAVVLITVLGIKYMMGSAQEKSGYQKSFIPLIVGAIVVVAALQIATMIFGVAGN